jgi:hypothetical protein
MDKVDALLREIAGMPELASMDHRSSSFLNDVAEIYERHGSGATRAYLLNQAGRRNRPEVPGLIKIIDKLEASPDVRTNRAIGRQIIKCLFQLKKGVRS